MALGLGLGPLPADKIIAGASVSKAIGPVANPVIAIITRYRLKSIAAALVVAPALEVPTFVDATNSDRLVGAVTGIGTAAGVGVDAVAAHGATATVVVGMQVQVDSRGGGEEADEGGKELHAGQN